MKYCRTCNAPLRGKFCSNCGEKDFDENDYTVKKFISQTVDVFTHFDGKFFRSIKFLLFYPGKLTVEYLSGRRVQLMKPVQLYILMAVAFFFLFKSWDIFFIRTQYLVLQKPKTEIPFYYKDGELKGSRLALKNYIEKKAKKEGVSFEQMITKIDNKTPNLSKGLIFLLIPIFGLLLYLIGYKKYRFYAQHLFHATHIFTFYLASAVIWIGLYILFIMATKIPINYGIAFIPVNILILVYAFFSIKRVYELPWLKAIFATLFFLFFAFFAGILYSRFITYFSVFIA